MKQFRKPSEENDKIFPNEYRKNAIIAFEVDGTIYILNEFYENQKAVAYSLHSHTIWKDMETMERLIEYLLGRGYFVYQFDCQKEFLMWAIKV